MNRSIKQLLTDRARLIGANVSTFYDDPLHIFKADGVWLWRAS